MTQRISGQGSGAYRTGSQQCWTNNEIPNAHNANGRWDDVAKKMSTHFTGDDQNTKMLTKVFL